MASNELSRETMTVTAVALGGDGRALVTIGRVAPNAPNGYNGGPYAAPNLIGGTQQFPVDKDKAPRIGDELEVVVISKPK